MLYRQWRANPNPDLDLNPDLGTFPKSSGFGFGLDLYIFNELDLSFFKRVDLDLDLDLKIGLDLDLNIAGFAHHWLWSTPISMHLLSECHIIFPDFCSDTLTVGVVLHVITVLVKRFAHLRHIAQLKHFRLPP